MNGKLYGKEYGKDLCGEIVDNIEFIFVPNVLRGKR
jgi:hypothetical protein